MLRDWLPYVLIGIVALVLIGATVLLSRLAWRRQVRRYILGLLGRREAIRAALNSSEGALRELAASTVQDLLAFAEPNAEERRTFSEIGARMQIESQEIAQLPLPKSLWELADVLGSAARIVAEQVGGVGDAEGDAALDALIALDMSDARAALTQADGIIERLSTVYDLSDPSVYGGGLYI